jgi:hypothetical protein
MALRQAELFEAGGTPAEGRRRHSKVVCGLALRKEPRRLDVGKLCARHQESSYLIAQRPDALQLPTPDLAGLWQIVGRQSLTRQLRINACYGLGRSEQHETSH